MSRILLGVSAGIAAYKSLEFVRLASAAGHAVRVVQTPASQRFVGRASFQALSGAPVLLSEFEADPARGTFPGQEAPAHEPLSHLALAHNADLFLIAPATANTLAKLAHGFAEDLLSSAALAASCPLVLAPAMNNHMYEHAATQANLELLRERGAEIVEPDVGRLASRGEEGVGRMAEPARLLEVCETVLQGEASEHARLRASAAELGSSWRGVKVLVTAGGTREPIDSVRFIGNSSSGRMGLALAQSALARGAEVTLVAANVSLPIPAAIRLRAVSTAAELEQACTVEFPHSDVLLMAAAVADFTPAAPQNGKIKKSGLQSLALELEATTDVLAEMATRRRDGQVLVGFAAEHGERAIADGLQKLTRKGLDVIVVNDISRADIGFDVDANEVMILTAAASASGAQSVGPAPKAQIAEAILDVVDGLRVKGTAQSREASG